MVYCVVKMVVIYFVLEKTNAACIYFSKAADYIGILGRLLDKAVEEYRV